MNAPDPRYFTPTRSGAPTPNGKLRLFHHGQILRRYSFDVALEGFKIAKQTIPGLEFDIYGDGEEQYIAELKNYICDNKLEQSVRLHDRVPVDRVPGLIEEADLGIVPCKKDVFVDKVMLPVRLLEYIAMNVPTIVSRVGTVETYFNDSEVAYYPHNDAQALANQIVSLYQNPKKCQSLVKHAREAFEKYTWKQQKEQYYRTIDKLHNRGLLQ